MSEDSTDADGVLVSPVHACLLAPSDNEDPGRGFDMSRGDEEAIPSELSVAHVCFAFSDIVEGFVCFLGATQHLRIFVFKAFDSGCSAPPVEEASEKAVLLAGLLVGESDILATGVQVSASVHEVICEERVGEGVAQGLFEGYLSVRNALHP